MKINIPEITAGDDVDIEHHITAQKVSFTVAPTAVVYCKIISRDKATAYTSAIRQTAIQAGANWAKSIVSIVMSASETEAISALELPWRNGELPALIATEINDNGKETYYGRVLLHKAI